MALHSPTLRVTPEPLGVTVARDRAPAGPSPRATERSNNLAFPMPQRFARHISALVVGVRWALFAIGLVLIAGPNHGTMPGTVIAATLLAVNLTLRTLWPIPVVRLTRRFLIAAALDIAIVLACVAISGGWTSPFALIPVGMVLLLGYIGGYPSGLAAAAFTGAALAVVDLAVASHPQAWQTGLQVGSVFATAGVLGGLARHLTLEAQAGELATVSQLERMATANELLLTLHGVAQTLPSSLDLGDVINSAQIQLRDLFEYSAITILVRDDSSNSWRIELAEGLRLGATFDDAELPVRARAAIGLQGAHAVSQGLGGRPVGFAPLARSGLYAPLLTRNSIVGVIAIEDTRPDRYTSSDAAILAELAEPLALAIDNALWFARLRTLGAEAERARIARDLHDRIAQSLAYVTFELERLAPGQPAEGELNDLHDVVRDVVGELRETLYQLRANVSADHPLDVVAREFLARYQDRTGISVLYETATQSRRLPLIVEQELWRMLQEAMVNVERHARASRVFVSFEIAADAARLEIRDDGVGFRQHEVGPDNYGLVGMRERADAVGAQLRIESEPGHGTVIVVELERAR
jgi:signal transduction histidine kinase